MTEEARERLEQANADLKKQVAQKDRRIEELEARLMGAIPGEIRERRQIYELPEMRMRVIEHQRQAIGCPVCQHVSAAHFPVGVDAPTQYGPRSFSAGCYGCHL